jgi:hypothetical protein
MQYVFTPQKGIMWIDPPPQHIFREGGDSGLVTHPPQIYVISFLALSQTELNRDGP